MANCVDRYILREIANAGADGISMVRIVAACRGARDVKQRVLDMVDEGLLTQISRCYLPTDEGRAALAREPLTSRDKPGLTNR